MPTYVYKFVDTGETIEIQQSFNDPTLTEAEHPVTGATMPVKKVFLPVGITFKGGGFYKTDSRGGSSSKSGTSTGESSSSSSDSSTSGGSSSNSSAGKSESTSTSTSATTSA